jgi:hypothetical protein
LCNIDVEAHAGGATRATNRIETSTHGERDGMRIPGKATAVFRCSFLCTGSYGQFMKRLLKMGNLRNLST